MGKIGQVENIGVGRLIPYVNNAKVHSEKQVAMIASSIREFGFLSPVLIDHDMNIIAGHGRVMAAEKLGMDEVPCVYVEGLTEAQRKAYILADNRLGELADWDMELVKSELDLLIDNNFDIDMTGFQNVDASWFDKEYKGGAERQEGNDEYNEFLDKFEIPKTTDDCYTPDKVYDAVADWVANEYGLDRKKFVRPFYPGGDYQNEKYKKGDIVVDNPPFSILSEIIRFYTDKKVKYFLFAPALTLFSSVSAASSCAICCGYGVIYENKANVATSFVTNLEDARFRSAPTLYKAMDEAMQEVLAETRTEIPKYSYPLEVVLSTQLSQFSKYGVDFKVSKDESCHIRQLESQKEFDKTIFGSGYLISEKAAAEKAAAEKAAAEKAAAEKAAATVWKLSDREKEIIRSLGNG